MLEREKSKMLFLKFISVICAILIFCIWQNNDILQTEFFYSNKKIPQSFTGYKIVQVSDLHNKEFGADQSKILKKIFKQSPDMIVVTGDLIDSRHTDIDKAMTFVEGAKKIAPVYYVTGNHESRSNHFPALQERLEEAGVVILNDATTKILADNGDYIQLVGLNNDSNYDTTLENIMRNHDKDIFTILLSHHPEAIDQYADHPIDLVFAGHAHGGQVRLPFIGGLIAPNQGFLPEYTSGIYLSNTTSMVVSRGLGNSLFPVRVFNRPELVTVTLVHEE